MNSWWPVELAISKSVLTQDQSWVMPSQFFKGPVKDRTDNSLFCGHPFEVTGILKELRKLVGPSFY